jgi:hypothetical protein
MNIDEIRKLEKSFSLKAILVKQRHSQPGSVKSLINEMLNIFDEISKDAIKNRQKLNIIKKQVK